MASVKKGSVGIGVVTYKRSKLLKTALLSCKKQTYKMLNVVISNDDPKTKLKKIPINDARFTYFIQSKNIGEVNNTNFVLKKCANPYFSWLADDDILYQDFISSCVKLLEENKDVVVVYPYFETGTFFKRNSFLCTEEPAHQNNYHVFNPREFALWYSENLTKIIGFYGVFRTSILKNVGGLTRLGNGFGPYSDTILPFKMTVFGKIAIIPKKLYFYRTHPNAMSIKSSDLDSYLSADREFINYLKKLFTNDNITYNKIKLNFLQLFFNHSIHVFLKNPMHSKVLCSLAFFKHIFTYYLKNCTFFEKLRLIVKAIPIFFFRAK